MRILLIDPPFYRTIGYYNRYFPLGITYLAAALRRHGCQVAVYDADCNRGSATDIDYSRLPEKYPRYIEALNDSAHPVWAEIRATLRQYQPQLVGITVVTPKVGAALKVASLCKEYDSACIVVMGGPHATLKPDEMLQNCPDADFIVRGEGETTLVAVVQRINGSAAGALDGLLADVKGVSYRRNDDIVHNPAQELIDDLDTVPHPARDLLMGRDSCTSEDMGLIMSSRGCPYECSYCATSIWRRKTRFRSIPNVIDEIRSVIDAYGARQFTFKDDSFTVNRNRVLELCDALGRENIKINWDCNTRVNLIDEELLRAMKKAGCNSVKVGIETGSERILDLISKKTTFEQCRRAARLFRKVGIFWTGYFMMGLPTETERDIRQTLGFMKELKPDFASISVYEPFPGTRLFDIGVEKGVVKPAMTRRDFFSTPPNHYYKADPNRQVDIIEEDVFGVLAETAKQEFHIHNKSFGRLLNRGKARIDVYVRQPQLLWNDFNKYLSWR